MTTRGLIITVFLRAILSMIFVLILAFALRDLGFNTLPGLGVVPGVMR